MSRSADVVVVGAGFAGLSAAHALRDAGLSVLVFEARERVGGRVESVVNGLGERLDTGGQYFCEGMDEIMALSRRLGRTWHDGLFGGRTVLAPPASTGVGEDDLFARYSAIRRRVKSELSPDDPAIAGLSVRTWTDRQPEGEDARATFLSAIEGLWCQPAERLPLWYLVSNDRRITNRVPELQYYPGGTMHALAEDWARELGDRVQLDEAVLAVERTGRRLRVKTARGTIAASHVVVAVPPVMARRIVHDPVLPADVVRALAAWRSGRVIKAMVRYRRPFWRDTGLSGSVMFLDPHGQYVCESSSDVAHARLTFFAGGSVVDAWRRLGADARRARLLAVLVECLGPEARDSLDVTMRDWTDDTWSGGGYSDTIMDMAATDAENVLRAGVPGISFGCSELASAYPGYVEGAIVAGRAAARQVAEVLRSGQETEA